MLSNHAGAPFPQCLYPWLDAGPNRWYTRTNRYLRTESPYFLPFALLEQTYTTLQATYTSLPVEASSNLFVHTCNWSRERARPVSGVPAEGCGAIRFAGGVRIDPFSGREWRFPTNRSLFVRIVAASSLMVDLRCLQIVKLLRQSAQRLREA